MIRGGLYSFHVSGFTPTPAAVIVVEALRPYLKTEPDWTMQNNLLALPEWQ